MSTTEREAARIKQDGINANAAIAFFAVAGAFLFGLAVLACFPPATSATSAFDRLLPFGLLFVGAIISALAGLALLEASNPSVPEVLPPHDRQMLAKVIQDGKDGAIDQYIRLRSMRGVSGFFQKLGLSGLPLATIFLTLVFCGFAMSSTGDAQKSMFDLAKLTLGAFIGSFVQRAARREPTAPG